VPVNDKIFEEINDVQYLWYQVQMSLDEKDSFELQREIAEHNAMFMNPEGVRKVRDARENTFETTDEDFDDMLEDIFGSKLEGKRENNINTYLNMELDEIKFTPIRGS